MEPQSNRLKTFYDKSGRKEFGYIMSDNIFRKKVNSSKHKLKLFDAYGIEEEVFDEVEKRKVEVVKILEQDKGRVLVSDFNDWCLHGVRRDFGAGTQVFLSTKYMKQQV